MVAVRDGRPLETTIGFSPTGGLMMGTRSGDLDPRAPLFLLNQKKLVSKKLERFVNDDSGLLGVSGTVRRQNFLDKLAMDLREDLVHLG
jgi:acetate kinase